MIKVGVIGAGYIGCVHLEELSRIGGVKVKRVIDVNDKLAKRAAANYNIELSSTDFRDVLNDPEIDVIHNCTPNKFHFEINKKALELGKHVLSEKPLAMNVKEAEELTEVAEKKNAVTGVDFCYRYYPVVQDAAIRVKRGELGDIRMVYGSWFQDWLSRETDYSWRLERSESGDSNITADLGSHWFDLVQFVTGKKVTEVLGDFATIIPVRKKPKQQLLAFQRAEGDDTEPFTCELEEYSSVLFRMGQNIPGTFTTSQICDGRRSEPKFEIYGSKGSIAWSHKDPTKLWRGYREKANEELIESPYLLAPEAARFSTLPAGHPLGYHDAVLNLFKDFYKAINDGEGAANKMNRPTFRTGYDEMRILDAIIISVRQKRWEKVK